MPQTRQVKYPDIHVRLTGTDGNAFGVMAQVAKALRKAGHGDQVEPFMKEAMNGDYDHLLRTAMVWVDVS